MSAGDTHGSAPSRFDVTLRRVQNCVTSTHVHTKAAESMGKWDGKVVVNLFVFGEGQSIGFYPQ